MDIKKIPNYSDEQAIKAQMLDLKANEAVRAGSAREAGASGGSDRVEFSQEYFTLDRIKKVADEMSDIRTERVEQLRLMIEKGLYVINPDKIAEKMLNEI